MKVISFLIVAENTQDRHIKLDTLWKITNLISGNEYNRVPAVTGSDLAAYCPSLKQHRTPFLQEQCFCIVSCSTHPLR